MQFCFFGSYLNGLQSLGEEGQQDYKAVFGLPDVMKHAGGDLVSPERVRLAVQAESTLSVKIQKRSYRNRGGSTGRDWLPREDMFIIQMGIDHWAFINCADDLFLPSNPNVSRFPLRLSSTPVLQYIIATACKVEHKRDGVHWHKMAARARRPKKGKRS